MADNNIPVLTEVYQPKKHAKPVQNVRRAAEITPELIARIAAELRPTLEKEIKATLEQQLGAYLQTQLKATLSQEISKAQATVLGQSTMDEASARLFQNLTQHIEDNAQEQLGLIDTQLGIMQQETIAQLRKRFNAEKTEIYNAVAAEVNTAFTEQMTAKGNEIRQTLLTQMTGELPAVQEVLRKNIQQLMTVTMTNLETKMRAELSAEIKTLLQRVKLVLPESGSR